MVFKFGLTKKYKINYGEDKEIDDFCEKICSIVSNGNYTSKLDNLCIIPMITPEELIAQGYGPELCKIELKYRIATITKRINFDDYINADIAEKKRLLTECLFSAIESKKRILGFNLEDFKVEVSKLLV